MSPLWVDIRSAAGGPMVMGWIRGRAARRRAVQRCLFAMGFEARGCGYLLDFDEVAIRAGWRCSSLRFDGPLLSANSPTLDAPGTPTVGRLVRSGEELFDERVRVSHADRDQGLGWLTEPRRRAAQQLVALGGRLRQRRWRLDLPHPRVDQLATAVGAVFRASRSFGQPPDRAPRIALHVLVHDPCPGVRLLAVQRLIARGELPRAVANRMVHAEHDEGVRLALMEAGGARSVLVGARLMLYGRRQHEAALALARIVKRDPYAAEAIDGVVEDLLVDRLIDALASEALGAAAAEALRGLYLPHLPQRLHERFGEGGPARAQALRWEAIARHRVAWGDRWPAAVTADLPDD